MNYFDDDHVMYEIRAFVQREAHELSINFSTGEIKPRSARSQRLAKSVASYSSGLADHLRRNNVDPCLLRNVTLRHKRTRLGDETTMLATDDRGVEHEIVVRNTA